MGFRYIVPEGKTINEVAKTLVTKATTSFAYPADENLLEPADNITKSYDLMDFIDDVYDFLNQYQQHTEEFKSFSFNPQFTYQIPADDEGNSLRYKVIERTPATTQAGVGPHMGRKDYKWRYVGKLEDLQNPGYKTKVYIKEMDNTIEFYSWSKNYRDANLFAFRLEELLDTYSYLFVAKGLNQIRYLGRQADQFFQTTSVSWYAAVLRYYVRTYAIKIVNEKALEEVTIEFLTKSGT
jgi:hypothetical protein